MSSRMRGALLNGVLVVASLLTCLLLLEGLCYFAKPTSRSSLAFVPGKGIVRVPGAYYVNRKEGYSEGRFNSHGFRDRDRDTAKAHGVFRIVVLGDSYTEGLQVPLEETFTALMERNLNALGLGERFEVLNLGQSGFGTGDEYVRYLAYGRAYSPDLVILAVCTGNDVRNNSKVLNRAALAYYFDLDEGGRLRMDTSVVDDYARHSSRLRDAFQWLKRRSYLASLISERVWLLRRAHPESEAEVDLGRLASGSRAIDANSDLNVYLEEPPGAWREAWRVTFALIEKLGEEVRKDGARLVVVTLSNPEQVDEKVQRTLPQRVHAVLDFDLPDRRIREFAARNDIPVVTLAPTFRKRVADEGAVLHGHKTFNTGHWNRSGHSAAADEITAFLRASGLLDKVPPNPKPVESDAGS